MTFSLLLLMLPSLSLISLWFESFSYAIHFLIKCLCLIFINYFHLLLFWFTQYSLFCLYILCPFLLLLFIFLVFLLIILLQALFLSSYIIWHSSSNHLFLCGLSSFPIIFPAASFIPFLIVFHISFVSSTSSNWVFCTFAVTSLMNSSFTLF